jgi:hypothetical protein
MKISKTANIADINANLNLLFINAIGLMNSILSNKKMTIFNVN